MATQDEIRAKDVVPELTDFRDDTDGLYGDGDVSSFFMKAMNLAKAILGRIHLLPTATASDLVVGNYIALDGVAGTKRLPANEIAPKSQQEYIKISLANAFDETQNYKANECVLYNGMYHRFLVDHPAGPWIGTDATGSKLDLNLLHRSRDNTDYLNGTKFILSSDGLYTASCPGEKIMTRLNGLRSEVPATIISYEYGYYMTSDGVTKGTNSTFALLTLDVTGCDSVYVRGYTGSSVAQVVFQDTNNVKVGEYVRALSSGYNEADVDVPPYAVKVLISYSFFEGRTLDFKLFKNVPDFKMYKETYSEYKYIDVDWSEAGVYLFLDGSISTTGGENWKNSGKLPIVGVEKIRITNRIVSGVLYAKFLDENDNEILPRQGGQNRTDNLLVVNVPANAASVILSVIDYVSSGNHSIEFAYKKENEKTDNNGMNDCFVKNLADVTMIPIFGQSLSVGSASTPCLTTKPKYKAGIQFNTGIRKSQGAVSFFNEFMPLFEQNAGMTQDSAGTGETPASGCCEKILETIQQEDGISVHSELWGTKKILFVCCGSGSKTVADLTNDYLDGFLNAVQAAKNICDAHGNTFSVPCWLWIQGETDQKLETTKADYKSALVSLQASIASGVRSITGQNYNPLCLLSQCAAQNIVLPLQISHPFNATALDVPTAQMELARDNSEFVFVLPNYILDHSSAEKIHLSNIGSRVMGLYFGVAAKHAMEGIADKSLAPTGTSVSGNDITLSVQVPTPPLQVDESWVYAVANKGFAVVNSSNSDILTSVDVRADKIILHCSASPVGCKLFYGLNGTAFYDGREEGSRGNIRDCSGNIYSGFVAGSQVCLHKYFPSFVMDII